MIRILVLLIVLGLVVWLTTLLPLPQPFHTLIWVFVILCLIWEVLAMAGFVKSFVPWNGPPNP
jgi:hypothetical protein